MSDRRSLRALPQQHPDDGPAVTLADMPDELLRNPGAFNPNGPRLDFRELRAARAQWLAEGGLAPRPSELDAERRRRWPVVDGITHAGESKRGETTRRNRPT